MQRCQAREIYCEFAHRSQARASLQLGVQKYLTKREALASYLLCIYCGILSFIYYAHQVS